MHRSLDDLVFIEWIKAILKSYIHLVCINIIQVDRLAVKPQSVSLKPLLALTCESEQLNHTFLIYKMRTIKYLPHRSFERINDNMRKELCMSYVQ